MRGQRKALLLLGAVLANTVAHAADKSAELRDRLKAAASLAALDDPALKPWHWQLDVTVFDNDGKNPSSGTLEMWFSGTSMLMRYSLRSEQTTVLRVGDKLYRTPGEVKQLPAAEFLQIQLVHPIPEQVFAPTATERITTEKLGNVTVDAIAPSLVKPGNDVVSTYRPFSIVLESTTPRLLVIYEAGGFQVVRQSVGLFQSHEVATDLQVYNGQKPFEEAKTVKLEAVSPNPAMFAVTPDMIALAEPIDVHTTDICGMVLSANAPSYPIYARSRHVQGTVVFEAMIGRDGHVLSLRTIGTADPSLVQEADRTVRTWIYRPFLVNGIPVEVKTEIHVNFTFG